MFEPIIKTDISMLPKSIETNLDELEPFITKKVEEAKSLVVNADSIEECERAEADAALLNKLSKRVSEFRLTWTKQWQSPFEVVIAKCKDYEKKLKDASEDLRSKAKVGRDKVREAKKESLRLLWEEQIQSMFSGLRYPHFKSFFEKMTDEKTTGCWTNRGKTIEKCAEEMNAELSRCVEALKNIKSWLKKDDLDIQKVAEDALGENFDVNEAIIAVNKYKAQQEAIERARKEAAEREAARQARLSASVPADAPAKPVEAPRVLVQDEPTEKVETYRLAITGTRTNLFALRKFGEEHGITFKNLDK